MFKYVDVSLPCGRFTLYRPERPQRAVCHTKPVLDGDFHISLATQAIYLRASSFNQDPVWQHKTNYQPTQSLADTARSVNFGAIIYLSVRDPQPAWCVADLSPHLFSETVPRSEKQTWWLAVNMDEVVWQRDFESLLLIRYYGTEFTRS